MSFFGSGNDNDLAKVDRGVGRVVKQLTAVSDHVAYAAMLQTRISARISELGETLAAIDSQGFQMGRKA